MPAHGRLRRRIAPLLFALLSGAAGAQPPAGLPLEIRGIEGERLANVRARVALARLDDAGRAALSPARRAYLLRQAETEAVAALQPFGLFSPTVRSALEGEPTAPRRLVLVIEPGEPVRVGELSLALSGPGEDDAALSPALAAFAPQPGAVFDSRVYETSKSVLQRLLAERGYFDARETEARVAVQRARRRADIALALDTGPRYRFGPTRISGDHLRPHLARAALTYAEGEPYTQAELLALHQRLSELDYYGLIDVRPEPDEAEDARVPIAVSLSPGRRSVYSAGLSFGTDSGAGLQLGFGRRWVNDRGHKFDARLDWAQRRRALLAQYRIPAFAWAQGWYSLGLNQREEDTRAASTRTTELVASRSGTWRGWDLSLATHLSREDFLLRGEPRSARRATTLVYPALRAARSVSDDVLYPTRGSLVSAELRVGARALGSDVDFAQLLLEGRLVRSLGERHRLLLRAQLGHTTAGGEFERLPPSLRFFAGGDRSVRGYGYQEIGPRQLDRVVGGRHLAVGSIELERRLTPTWGVAAFVDAGDAFNDGFQARTGVGLGLRWRSPVGPVRLDLARGLDEADRGLRLHLGIGPDL